MNNAPFYVGQRVVCVDDSQPDNPWFVGPRLKKGQQYIIESLEFSYGYVPELWYAVLSGMPKDSLYACRRFAPITEAHIPASLKEQAEEMIQVKETVKREEVVPC